jgi:oxygen-independent coproporphyrinogen-3 oxidase
MPGAGVPEGVGRLWARVYISFMHLYIHVPFCGRRCSYCDFAIAVRKAVPSQAYLDAVLGEWTLWQEEEVWDESPGIETIYLGGGTPSRIAPEVIGRLLNRIAAARAVVSGAEITLEANPDDVTSASVSGWKAAGVNRISLGVQSFDPAVLRWMHRLHSVDQVYRSVAAIRDAGFTNLSLDLIFGLPEAQRRDWANDLEEALALEPEHLSLYGLTVEPHTPLGRWTDRGEVKPVGEGRYAAEFLLADEVLRGRAYEHYEVSNFCRPGHRAVHNAAYWSRSRFIGLGPAAHSGLGRERRWNVREWAAYQRIVAAGQSPLAGREHLDEAAVALEQVYLGLRTESGAPAGLIPEDLGRQWCTAGWARPGPDRVRLTPEGWLRLDALVAAVPG